MRKSLTNVLLCSSALLAGCSVDRGVHDYANPLFDLHFGVFTVIAFPSSTVLQIGYTNFNLSLPFYVPPMLFFLLLGLLFLFSRRRRA